jgi:hypothetical protein
MQGPRTRPGSPRNTGLLSSFYTRIEELKENFLMDVTAILQDIDELTEIEIKNGTSTEILRDDDLEPLAVVTIKKEYPNAHLYDEPGPDADETDHIPFPRARWNDLNRRIHAMEKELKAIGQDFWPGIQPVTVRHAMKRHDDHQTQDQRQLVQDLAS